MNICNVRKWFFKSSDWNGIKKAGLVFHSAAAQQCMLRYIASTYEVFSKTKHIGVFSEETVITVDFGLSPVTKVTNCINPVANL